jgi:hypothetical protein
MLPWIVPGKSSSSNKNVLHAQPSPILAANKENLIQAKPEKKLQKNRSTSILIAKNIRASLSTMRSSTI